MAEEKELTGWERSRAAQKGFGGLYVGLAIVTAILAGIWIGSHLFSAPDSSAFGLNLWTEGIGMLVTVGLFGLVNQRQAERRYKLQLVDEAASTSNEIAKHAVHVMRRRGWLQDEGGLLRGANLSRADLRGAFLRGVSLEGANLDGADLREADLTFAMLAHASFMKADLRGIRLSNANLQHANLAGVDLRNTNLSNIDLRRVNLTDANLKQALLPFAKLQDASLIGTRAQGADFSEADMQGVHLRDTLFDETTVLPDGNNWSHATDIERFINPNHKTFWRSGDPQSPAFDKQV